MALSSDSDIERLALAMIACTLPKAEWTHEGHFVAALWLLRHRAHLATPDAMRGLILRYNDATNTPNTDTCGYHHSITAGPIRLAAGALAAGKIVQRGGKARLDAARPGAAVVLEHFSTCLNRKGIPSGGVFWFRIRAGEGGRHGWAYHYRWICVGGFWRRLMRG